MSKQLIVPDVDEGDDIKLYVLAPSLQRFLWVDIEERGEAVTMNMDRAGATALRDFLTDWLDTDAE